MLSPCHVTTSSCPEMPSALPVAPIRCAALQLGSWAKDHWALRPYCASLGFQAVRMLPVEFHVFGFFKFYLGALQRLSKAEGANESLQAIKKYQSTLFALCTNLCSDAI